MSWDSFLGGLGLGVALGLFFGIPAGGFAVIWYLKASWHR